jgi:hypothetical protein
MVPSMVDMTVDVTVVSMAKMMVGHEAATMVVLSAHWMEPG